MPARAVLHEHHGAAIAASGIRGYYDTHRFERNETFTATTEPPSLYTGARARFVHRPETDGRAPEENTRRPDGEARRHGVHDARIPCDQTGGPRYETHRH